MRRPRPDAPRERMLKLTLLSERDAAKLRRVRGLMDEMKDPLRYQRART